MDDNNKLAPPDTSAGYRLTIRKIGNSTGVIFPKELLAKLGLREGDQLDVVEQASKSLRLSAYEPQFSKAMEIARKGMKRYRNALAELAK